MHPYQEIGPRHFWATGVAQKGLGAIGDLWIPKHAVTRHDAVATFGSCFAQHFGQALKQRGFNWLNTEPGPESLSEASCRKFNYNLFSARTGNIYTASMLKQWVSWALEHAPMPDEIWYSGGRYFDPFRPAIEPNGFATIDEVRVSQQRACRAFARALGRAKVFVFTLGLTECWVNSQRGHEYPVCPGVTAGEFDSTVHQFVNQQYPFIHETLSDVIRQIHEANSGIRVLLTVSPVPLTATMSGNHVLVATMESKSILRAVAGSLARELEHVDYFPSYEIISAPAFGGQFFEANLRTVGNAGVEHVMNCFFDSLNRKFGDASANNPAPDPTNGDADEDRRTAAPDESDVICEELLLEAFSPKTQA